MSRALSTTSTTLRALPFTPRSRLGIVRAMLAVSRRVVAGLERARRRSAWLRELRSLDDRTLHDIGLHRSEIGSAVAELLGTASATRRRGSIAE